MKVRFKLAWQSYRVGDIIEPPGVLRDFLLRFGYVLPVDDVPMVEKMQTRKKKNGRRK